MKGLILALLLSPSQAWAADPTPCTTDAVRPCTASLDENREIIKLSQQALAAGKARDFAWREYNELRTRCDGKSDIPGACNNVRLLELLSTVFDKDQERWRNEQAAINAVRIAYHVNSAEDIPQRMLHDPEGRGSWRAGKLSTFAPLALPSLSAGNGKVHPFQYQAADIDHPDELVHRSVEGQGDGARWRYAGTKINDSQRAGTFGDSWTYVYSRVFKDVACEDMQESRTQPCLPNAGRLANVLYHELQHFNQQVIEGSANKEFNEASAWRETKKNADIFELDADDKASIEIKLAACEEKLASIKARHMGQGYSSIFPSDDDEKAAESEFGRMLGKREEMEKEFDDLRNKVAADTKRRQEESKRQQELNNPSDERLRSEAQRCGLELAGNGRTGFTLHQPASSSSGNDYDYAANPDLDIAMVDMFMARACHEYVHATGSYTLSPCNDALEIMNRRWAEPGFRDKLKPVLVTGTDSWFETQGCIVYMAKHLQSPITLERFINALPEAWKYIGRLQEDRRRNRPQPEPPRRESRPPASPKPRPDSYDHCIDPGGSCLR